MKLNQTDSDLNKLDFEIKNILDKRLKNVREDLLLGEIKINANKTKQKDSYFTKLKEINSSFNEDFQSNGIIVKNLSKSYNIKITNEKRRQLVSISWFI